jgi:hypothetical protein
LSGIMEQWNIGMMSGNWKNGILALRFKKIF